MQNQNINKLIDKVTPPGEIVPETIDEVINCAPFSEKIALFEHSYGKKFAEMECDVQDLFVFRRAQQLVNILKLNPVWNERINKSAIKDTPVNFEEWQQLPITDRETLNELYMGTRPGLVVPLSNSGFQIIASGGTSGGLPIETVYSIRELHDTYRLSGDFFDKYLIRNYLNPNSVKWIITTLSDYEMWSSGTMIGGILQNTPNINFIAAGPMSQKIYNHILSFEGDKAIMGMSREIEGLIELGESIDAKARESFKLAIYGSGILQPYKDKELKQLYPYLQIISYFASNQAEAIGVQLHPDSYLTTVPGLHLIEIVDENGKWVQEGEEGELVITRLHAQEVPILRMQLGDRMIRRPALQHSVLKAQQMEFAGRSGDIIHLGESHYAAPQVYAILCRELKQLDILDIQAIANEVQFLNNRKEKRLYLLISSDNTAQITTLIENKLNRGKTRKLFIEALKQALSLFDQTEKQFKSLGDTTYEFRIKPVEKDSNEIHRTRVNKTPLIRDQF